VTSGGAALAIGAAALTMVREDESRGALRDTGQTGEHQRTDMATLR